MSSMEQFIAGLPKAELHIHLDGALEPALLLRCAERNEVAVPFETVEDVRKRYQFTDLQSFLDLMYMSNQVLHTEQDFYELTFSYLKKAASQTVLHSEMYFELQTYVKRDINPHIVIEGMIAACRDARQQFGISSALIFSVLRNLPQEECFAFLPMIEQYREHIIAVGLASAERNNPPSKFEQFFAEARKRGFHCVAHAGEEVGPEYIWQALTMLHAERIDHGIRCLEDPALVARLREQYIPLTVCPLSNVALHNVSSLSQHPLKQMLQAGLNVSIHSDDPAYFGGYINENYSAAQKALHLSQEQIVTCARNSFQSAFLDNATKDEYLKKLESYCALRK